MQKLNHLDENMVQVQERLTSIEELLASLAKHPAEVPLILESDNLAKKEEQKESWCHIDTPPKGSGFCYGPLTGTLKNLASAVDMAEKTLRKSCAEGFYWMRGQKGRRTWRLYFNIEGDFKKAKKRLDQLTKQAGDTQKVTDGNLTTVTVQPIIRHATPSWWWYTSMD